MYLRVKAAQKASPEKIRSTLAKHYPDSTSTTLVVPLKSTSATAQIYAGNKLPAAIMSFIFELFETNMKAMYESTEDGYEPKEKKEELFDQQSRFIILRTPDSPNPFAYGMFRFDTEETMGDKYAQVLYCYEVQIEPTRQSIGAGRVVMDLMQHVAKDWHMEKVILTVFKSNANAIRFYERNGFTVDEISPSQLEKEEDQDVNYEIYSKVVV